MHIHFTFERSTSSISKSMESILIFSSHERRSLKCFSFDTDFEDLSEYAMKVKVRYQSSKSFYNKFVIYYIKGQPHSRQGVLYSSGNADVNDTYMYDVCTII